MPRFGSTPPEKLPITGREVLAHPSSSSSSSCCCWQQIGLHYQQLIALENAPAEIEKAAKIF
jgi:hypothetical protein